MTSLGSSLRIFSSSSASLTLSRYKARSSSISLTVGAGARSRSQYASWEIIDTGRKEQGVFFFQNEKYPELCDTYVQLVDEASRAIRRNDIHDEKYKSDSNFTPKSRLLLTLPYPHFHINLGFCDLSCLGMGRPEPFDIRNYLTPHIPLFMSVCSFLLCQSTSGTVASRHGGFRWRFRKDQGSSGDGSCNKPQAATRR